MQLPVKCISSKNLWSLESQQESGKYKSRKQNTTFQDLLSKCHKEVSLPTIFFTSSLNTWHSRLFSFGSTSWLWDANRFWMSCRSFLMSTFLDESSCKATCCLLEKIDSPRKSRVKIVLLKITWLVSKLPWEGSWQRKFASLGYRHRIILVL